MTKLNINKTFIKDSREKFKNKKNNEWNWGFFFKKPIYNFLREKKKKKKKGTLTANYTTACVTHHIRKKMIW